MTRPKYPKQTELMEVFEYIDGELWRKAHAGADGRNMPRKLVKNKANSGGGRCRAGFKDQFVFYHAIVKILVDRDARPGEIVDHEDGDPLNNSPENLIWASISENMQNHRKHREGKVPGVKRVPSGRFRADTEIEGKPKYLGTYDTELEAFDAYIEANRALNRPVGRLLKIRAEFIERNAA